MCGIVGFVSVAPSETNKEAVVRRMADSISHRGPDNSGFYCDSWAALGHRRLTIIDLAAGRQPIENETGTSRIIYNGEIFNHAGIRTELERLGHRYQTRTDTETILHAYEEYGPDCLKRFRGMFAFAIWDAPRRTLFCARDRLGIKPFYYFWDGRLFAFGSEIKALLEHPDIPTRLEESILPEYLAFGYVSGEQTFFAGIRKLMPGCHLTLRVGDESPQFSIRRYWDLPKPEEVESRSDEAWISDCRSRLEETVRMRLMSDVPLGAFLSGGVDSSAVAAIMKRQADGPVQTFAVGYREGAYSELDYARRASAAIGTEHHEVLIGRGEFFNALPKLVWHEDEPITWPSSVSLYFVSRLAAERVKVVLTGEGSDELFAGYGRYRYYLLNSRALNWYRFVPGFLRRAIRRRIEVTPLLGAALRRRLRHTVLARGESFEELHLDNFYCAFSAAELEKWLTNGQSSQSAYANYLSCWETYTHPSLLERMLSVDRKTYLVELLMKQDQMSMACSIESRVPFLDHTFVEFATRVPDHLKIHGGEAKYILKKAVADLLPRDIVYRRKMGFPTPLAQWLLEAGSAPLYSLLRDPKGLLASCIEQKQLEQLITHHQARAYDHTDRLWRLLNLQLWGDVFLSGGGRNRLDGPLLPTSAHLQ